MLRSIRETFYLFMEILGWVEHFFSPSLKNDLSVRLGQPFCKKKGTTLYLGRQEQIEMAPGLIWLLEGAKYQIFVKVGRRQERAKACHACVNSQLFGIFSKQTWLKVLLSWYFIVKKHEMWSFSFKFGELRHKNVNNTFMIKQKFTSKGSQPHTRLATLGESSRERKMPDFKYTLCLTCVKSN